jgi:hypothetical protein
VSCVAAGPSVDGYLPGNQGDSSSMASETQQIEEINHIHRIYFWTYTNSRAFFHSVFELLHAAYIMHFITK